MPPNRKRRAAAMDPAAGGAGQQRQNKASAGKKAKKGGGSGSGSGGRWPAVKPKKDLQINRLKGTHLLTIPDFFTSAEAKTFIDVAESMSFTHQGSLGPLKGEAYRDNDRISVTDPLLAQAIWESGINRIFTDISVSGKVATGLNPNIRFYRYTEGQRFGRHIDESVDLGDGSKTYYTLLIYLSGKGSAKDSSAQALVGGETVFYDQRGGVVAEQMAPCYVVFHGKQLGIYRTWYECSEQVLGFKNARYLKYKNYEEALRDFNASRGAATPLPSQLLPDDCCHGIPLVDGKSCYWKNVVIISLLIVVIGLWIRVSMAGQCKCQT